MSEKLKILILSEEVNRNGGIEKYICDLNNALRIQLGPENVFLLSVPAFRFVLFRRIFTLVSLIYHAFRLSPDYIICAHIYLTSYILFINRLLKIPYLICTYGIEIWRDLPDFQTEALRNAAKVLTISSYTKRKLIEKGIPEEKISFLYTRVNIDQFNKSYDVEKIKLRHGLHEKKVILIVGRMVSWEQYKGHDELITVMPKIRKKMPETVLLIVGSGDDVKRLQNLAVEFKVNDSVVFAGRVSEKDLPSYYHACDLFVMPSRVVRKENGWWGGEGFGIVFLEASACGKPVIGANSGGVPDAVLDNKTGLLVNSDNDNSLTEAIFLLLKDKEYAALLGHNGREWVKQFDLKGLPKAVEKILNELNREKSICAV